MSFSAGLSHEGYIVFHEVDPIDYNLLRRNAGPDTPSRLQQLLQSRIPIQDPELLKRCKNSRKFHHDTKAGAITSGLMQGVASGLTFGLSEVAYKKSFPRLKEKHLPPLREAMLQAVADCGLTPDTIVVLDQYAGDNDLEGVPDLVPEYQFWMLYIKEQNKKTDFSKLQAVESLRHEEKKLLLFAEKAQIDATGNSGVGGLVQTIRAKKAVQQHKERALELEQERLALEAELEKDAQMDGPTTIRVDDSSNSGGGGGYGYSQENYPPPAEEEVVVAPSGVKTTTSTHYIPNNTSQRGSSTTTSSRGASSATPKMKKVTRYRVNPDGSRTKITETSQSVDPSAPPSSSSPIPVAAQKKKTKPPVTTTRYRVNPDGTRTKISDVYVPSSEQSVHSTSSTVSSLTKESANPTTTTTTYHVAPDGRTTQVEPEQQVQYEPEPEQQQVYCEPEPAQQQVYCEPEPEQQVYYEPEPVQQQVYYEPEPVQQQVYSAQNIPLEQQGIVLSEKQRKEGLTYYNNKFKTFMKKMKGLVTVLKKDHEAQIQRHYARTQVANELSAWMDGTPLTTTTDSYASVYGQIDQLNTLYEQTFDSSILQNATQWEECVKNELNNAMKEGRNASNNLDHYERKTNSLRNQYNRTANTQSDAGRNVYMKLERNETKYAEASRGYAEQDARLRRCDEVIDHSWMVLHALLIQLFEADLKDAKEKARAMSNLRGTLASMSSAVKQKGLAMESSNCETVWNHLISTGPLNLVPVAGGAALASGMAMDNHSDGLPCNAPGPSAPMRASHGQEPPLKQGGEFTGQQQQRPPYQQNYRPEQRYNDNGRDDNWDDLSDTLDSIQDAVEDYLSDAASAAEERREREEEAAEAYRRGADPPEDPPDDDGNDYSPQYDEEPELARRDEQPAVAEHFYGEDYNYEGAGDVAPVEVTEQIYAEEATFEQQVVQPDLQEECYQEEVQYEEQNYDFSPPEEEVAAFEPPQFDMGGGFEDAIEGGGFEECGDDTGGAVEGVANFFGNLFGE